jgi:ATP-dependent DNA helicase RecG
MSLEQLQELMKARENEHLEFKEAKANFHFERLVKYCVALANEGGGTIILGVTDKFPRKVVGSQAFENLERTKAGLIERLQLRIEATEIGHPSGRVIVFTIPSRPVGVPIPYQGAYWMRGGDELVPMTSDMLKRIFDEAAPDFSAEICSQASIDDLDPAAIQELRTRWQQKSGNEALKHLSDEQLLTDAELIVNGGITYAALTLLGTHRALGRHLAQAEVIFEYRSTEAPGAAQQRKEYRQGFLLFLDDIWNTINLRNDKQHYQEGFFVYDVPTFNEVATREAILNAVTHREYRLPGSVFVRQYQRRLEVTSPGGFPPGITPENILWKQSPRNRRVADITAKCGLVERAGQGVDLMFKRCILESKPLPDFSRSDEYEVWVTLHGQIQDPQFLRFLEKIGREKVATFTTHDLLALDLIHREQIVSQDLRPRLAVLAGQGIIEKVGRGRGSRYILSQEFYSFLKQKGVYTRKRGLDKETNKALLLKHIKDSGGEGSTLSELLQVLPSLSRDQVQKLLQEMKAEGRVYSVGRTRAGRWHVQSNIAPKMNGNR